MKRLQRTASTAPRDHRWWKRIPLTTGAIALAIQSVMSGLILAGGFGSGLVALVAIGFAGMALNSRNAIVISLPGILTVLGAGTAFGTGWASVPVLGAFGMGSWLVSFLLERTRNGRRESYSEPLASRNDVLAAGGIASVTAVLTAVVFLITLLPKLPAVATATAALLIAAVAVVALGASLHVTRAENPGNEDYFRVGTAIEASAASSAGQIGASRAQWSQQEAARKRSKQKKRRLRSASNQEPPPPGA